MRRALILVPLVLLVLVGLFFLLRPSSSGPGSAAAPGSSPGTTTTESSAGGPQEQTLNLAIKGNTMTPSEITVGEGDKVNLQITSDNPVELHLHGYDLEKEVEPGEPAELSFDATITGRFDIEDHDTDTELGVLLVQPR